MVFPTSGTYDGRGLLLLGGGQSPPTAHDAYVININWQATWHTLVGFKCNLCSTVGQLVGQLV